jgi:serine/threonine protein kinase
MNEELDLSKSCFFSVHGDVIDTVELLDRSAATSKILVGTIVDKKFKILSLLGKGGMGEVYLAHHLMLGKDVALKTFTGSDASADGLLRFQREAQSIGRLNHENVIQIFDFGISEDGLPYYTMEHLIGESLAERIKRLGALELETALRFFIQVCEGLSEAHDKGIVHRDLKPGNLFIEHDRSTNQRIERVKIVDFGIASLTAADSGLKLTAHGTVFGSPLYMSPEQAKGESVTPRSDIYSLGCALFEALVGDPPLRGQTALETIIMHKTEIAPLLNKASSIIFPQALEKTIASMLAKDPEARPQKIDQVSADLSAILSDLIVEDTPSNSSEVKEPTAIPLSIAKGAMPHSDDSKQIRNSTKSVFLLAALIVLSVVFFVCNNIIEGYKNKNSLIPPQEFVGDALTPERPDEALSQSSIFKSRVVTRGGRRFVIFDFPGSVSMGHILLSGRPDHERIPIVSGYEYAINPTRIEFYPSENFLNDPRNFEIVPNDFLTGIRDCVVRKNRRQVLRHIAKHRQIKTVMIRECDVDDEEIQELYKLENVKYLAMDDTKLSGAALAAWPNIEKLRWLSFCDSHGVSVLLEKLKGSRDLKTLHLDGTPLTKEDLKIVCTFSNMEDLHIRDANLDDDAFKSLAALKKLVYLDLQNCKILSKNVVEQLTKMGDAGLKDLYLSGNRWSKADIASLEQHIADVRFGGTSAIGVKLDDVQNYVNVFNDVESDTPNRKRALPLFP